MIKKVKKGNQIYTYDLNNYLESRMFYRDITTNGFKELKENII